MKLLLVEVDQEKEVEEQKAEFVKDSALSIFEAAGLSDRVQFHYETGLLVDAIDAYAARADLVLLGKRGENVNFATKHLGSMLERVVRSLSKPCLVTPRKFRPIDHVAVAYDGSPSCKEALEFMSKVELFSAFNLQLIVVNEGRHEDEAAKLLAEAEVMLNRFSLYPACQVLNGVAETAIADYVKQTKVDLLVAGAYGHTRIRELLIGSTTTALLRNCHVPVLCFR